MSDPQLDLWSDLWEVAPIRVRRAMDALHVRSIADLLTRTEAEFLAMPNFGLVSLQFLKDFLLALGLRLKSFDPPVKP